MKNTFGTNVAVTLFGESHGAAVGAVIDGLAPGIPVRAEFIAAQMDKRRAYGAISTARRETDGVEILSGVFDGKTTGTPLCLMIRNSDTHSGDYAAHRSLARPGHADYTAYLKYHGFEDYRGGGHFSGRITAALTAAGAIVIDALAAKGIMIGTHIARCGGVDDLPFGDLSVDLPRLNGLSFAVLDEARGEAMQKAISDAARDGDSVGGVLETAVTGVPGGAGEPWFDTVESVLAHGLYAIPAIKGVQFGVGFDGVDLRGSEYNDAFELRGGAVVTKTNRNGGINGGITNGMPILFRCAVKPTPSIYREQKTVDFIQKNNTTLSLQGRHDPAVIHRARVVVDSVTALCLADLLAARFGTDWLGAKE